MLLLLQPLATSAQELEHGLPWKSGGWIDRGSGYDIASGLPKRTVVDFDVPGAVGAYPLRCARTMTVMSNPKIEQGVYTYSYWDFDFFYRLYETPAKGGFLLLYPNGTRVFFDGTGRAPGVGDRMESKGRSVSLLLSDGGRVEFDFLNPKDLSEGMVGTTIVDPHGLRTKVVPQNKFGPARIEDASGRWIQFDWGERDGVPAIRGARSSAGQNVAYTTRPGLDHKFYPDLIERADYSDGSHATYDYSAADAHNSCYQFLPLELNDVRSTSAMPYVRLEWKADEELTCVISSEYAIDGSLVSSRIPSPLFGQVKYFREVLPSGEQVLYEIGPGGTLERKSQIARNARFDEHSWTFDYSPGTFLNYVKDPLGREWRILPELVTGKPLVITYPDQSTKKYTYTDPSAPYFVETITDERDKVTIYHRYPDGRVHTISYPDDTSESWEELDRFGNAHKHILRNGAHEYRDYDDLGRLTTRFEPIKAEDVPKDPREPLPKELGFTTYTYYRDGHPWEDLLESETDPLGHKTTYEYACWAGVPCFSTIASIASILPTRPGDIAQPGAPVSGRPLPTRIRYHDGTSKRFTYDAYGNKTSETDEEEHTQTWTYDEFNRIKSHTDANQRGSTTYSYALMQAAASTLNPIDVSLSHDPIQHGPLSHTSRAPSVVTSPEGNTNCSVYDLYGRLMFSVEALGTRDVAVRRFDYDDGGRLEKQYDPRGRLTKFTYDLRDRRKTMTDPEKRVTTWEYDSAGNVERIIYPKPVADKGSSPDEEGSRTVSFTYDEVNRVQTRTDEKKQTTTYVYRGGQLEDFVDHEQRESWLRYDASGRVTSRWVPGNDRKAKLNETLIYDKKGNLKVKRNDARGTSIGYDYDTRDRELKRTYSDGTPPRTVDLFDDVGRPKVITDGRSRYEFDYDAAGQVERVRQRYGSRPLRQLTYHYDRDGHRTSMDAPSLMGVYRKFTWRGQVYEIGDSAGKLAEYRYYPDGQRDWFQFANGERTTYLYDDTGRLKTVDGPGITDRTYGYDERSRVTRVDSIFTERVDYFPNSEVMSYERMSRVPQACGDGGGRAGPPAHDAFTYDGSGNRLTSAAHGTYVVGGSNRYDAVAGAQPDTFAYDAAGNLEGRNGWRYTYDAESRLTSATNAEGQARKFAYDVLGNLVAVEDEQGSLLRYALYDGDHPIAWYRDDEVLLEATVWGVQGDEPLLTNRIGHATAFYHLDRQNNVVQISNWHAQPVQAFYYGAFGEPTALGWANGSWCAAPKDADLPSYLFTGQPWFAELGLYHFRARAYDPQLGRFLQRDPLGVTTKETNLYRYSQNNPRNLVDPDGKDPSLLWDAANVALDVADIATDIKDGNYMSATIGVVALAADAAAGVVPLLPALAGPARRALRAGEAIQDGVKAAKGVEAAADGLRKGEKLTEAAGEAATAASKVSGEAVDTAGALCFAAGTLIHTETGLRPIEEVKDGDLVWSRDESTGAVALRKVLQTFETLDQKVVEVGLEGDGGSDLLAATGDHPLWTQRGWVGAQDLLLTDKVLLRSSGWADVKAVRAVDRRQTVYNLEVEGFHTYFVGGQGAWVHNTCAGGGGRAANKLKPDTEAAGSHSTFKRGQDGKTSNYATYEPNSKNPAGFQETKRVDVTGKAHRNPDGTVVPTPHVKETGSRGVRPATPEELP